jgi:hypothetical protein
MKKDTSNFIDLDIVFSNNNLHVNDIIENKVPDEVAARIDLVNVYGVAQKAVDSMTTDMVLLEYNNKRNLQNTVVDTNIDIDTILREWSWRCDKGYPDFNNISDRIRLQEVLDELNIPLPFDKISEAPVSPLSKKAPSNIEGSNTPELKEGLVIYFSTQKPKDIDAAINKCSDPNNTDVLKFSTDIDNKFYGIKSSSLVSKAISLLNTSNISANNAKLFLNALSIAKKIQAEFGILSPDKIDRGDYMYTKIRAHAVKLVSEMGLTPDADKWCPADIYIYNNAGAAKQALQSDDLNIGKTSLNSMFNTEFNSAGGIVGISLKEEKAQAGKANSFKKILTKEENYPTATALTPVQKSTMELLYNLNILSSTKSKDTPKLKIGYVSEAARIITANKIPNTDALLKSLTNTLRLTFKGDMKRAFGQKGGFNKDATRKSFAELGISDITYDKNLLSLIDTLESNLKKNALDTYKSSRKSFIDTLIRLNFNVPAKAPDVNKMNSETLYKKSSCYMTAEYLLSGLNSEQLQIPVAYKSIITQKNAFVALTAYAIGMAGISPTFFKLVGSSSGKEAHLEPFYGDGFLNVDENTTTKIVDTNEYKGFYVEFIAAVSKSASKKSKVMSKYKVTLDFRFAGDQLNIEVSDLKQA